MDAEVAAEEVTASLVVVVDVHWVAVAAAGRVMAPLGRAVVSVAGLHLQ